MSADLVAALESALARLEAIQQRLDSLPIPVASAQKIRTAAVLVSTWWVCGGEKVPDEDEERRRLASEIGADGRGPWGCPQAAVLAVLNACAKRGLLGSPRDRRARHGGSP